MKVIVIFIFTSIIFPLMIGMSPLMAQGFSVRDISGEPTQKVPDDANVDKPYGSDARYEAKLEAKRNELNAHRDNWGGNEFQVPSASDILTSGGTGETFNQIKENYKGRSASLVKKGAKLVGGVLTIVDVGSTIGGVLAHLSEGDRLGAKNLIERDATKKLSAAGGGALMSFIPVVGPIVGTVAGEKFFEKTVDIQMEKEDKERRYQEAKDKYAGPNFENPYTKPITIRDRNGKVRELSSNNFYVGKKSGKIKRRTASEQRAWKRAMDIKWNDSKKLISLDAKLESGEISKEEHDQYMDQFKKRDPNKPWEPGSLSIEESEDTELEEPEELTEPEDGNILNYVTPTKLTAKGYSEDDMSSRDVKNIVSTTFTMSFWNVGSMVPGYENASIKIKSVASSNSSVEENTYRGIFSGGPNGTFTMNFDGETYKFKLFNGSYIDAMDVKLNVTNSGAFKNWPNNN